MEIKKGIRFILLTCLVSWITAGIAVALGLQEAKGLAYTIFGACYMWLPGICALILQKAGDSFPFR